MRNVAVPAIAAFMALLPPRPAMGQFDILERLVSKVEGLSLYHQLGELQPGSTGVTTSGSRSNRLSGFGIELSIALGTIRGSRELTPEECDAEKAEIGTVDTVDVYTETRIVDERRTTTTVVRTKPRPDLCQPADVADLQLALGYSQLRGFRASDPTVDVYGSVAESPAVALYLALLPDRTVSPYFGVRAGRAQMHALRGYDANQTIYDGTSTTLQAGVAAGVSTSLLGLFELVLEPSYVVRNFSSVEWRTVSGSSQGMLPEQLPRSLNMSGWLLSVGIDFTIPKPD